MWDEIAQEITNNAKKGYRNAPFYVSYDYCLMKIL